MEPDPDERISDVNRLNETLSKQLRRVDENKINQVLDSVPDAVLSEVIRKRLPKPSNRKRKIVYPMRQLESVVRTLGLLDETDYGKRAQIFIAYCRLKGYTYNTTLRYFRVLETNGLFGTENTVFPSKFAFSESGRPHQRVVSMESFVRMARYLHENFSRYTAPFLIALYTGLRTFEILQWSTLTLEQLNTRQEYVSVSRKQTVRAADNNEPTFWRPVYTTRFVQFVSQMVQLYRPEYERYVRTGIMVRLFYVTNATLVNRIRQIYYECNDHYPPRGFGVHSCRNMIATLMAQSTDNITAIQTFLQHRRSDTTRRYVGADFSHMTEEFNRLTDNEFAQVRANLAKRSDGSSESPTARSDDASGSRFRWFDGETTPRNGPSDVETGPGIVGIDGDDRFERAWKNGREPTAREPSDDVVPWGNAEKNDDEEGAYERSNGVDPFENASKKERERDGNLTETERRLNADSYGKKRKLDGNSANDERESNTDSFGKKRKLDENSMETEHGNLMETEGKRASGIERERKRRTSSSDGESASKKVRID